MSALEVAIIGCGEISKLHMAAMRKLAGEIRVTAVVDPVLERAQKINHETGAKIYSTFEQALHSGRFSAVILLLPHHLHRDYAVLALKAGKHVLLEKPMATNIEECRAILEFAEHSGKILMVSENAQYWPEIVYANKQIKAGMIGIPVTAAVYFNSPIYERFERHQFWRFDNAKAGGGIVMDGGLHWIRMLRMLMGEIDSVFARAMRTMEEMQGESLCIANFHFKSGAIGTFSAMNISSAVGQCDIFRISGTEGEIILRSGPESRTGYDGNPETNLMLYTKEFRDGKEIMKAEGYAASFYTLYLDFLAAIHGIKKPEAGPESAIMDIRVAHAIYQSVRLGENIRMDVLL